MADPLVAKVIDPDGVEWWGAADAPWVQDATTAAGEPENPVPSDGGGEEVVADAAAVPADGAGPNPRSGKRRP